jgi:hypothetical protein
MFCSWKVVAGNVYVRELLGFPAEDHARSSHCGDSCLDIVFVDLSERHIPVKGVLLHEELKIALIIAKLIERGMHDQHSAIGLHIGVGGAQEVSLSIVGGPKLSGGLGARAAGAAHEFEFRFARELRVLVASEGVGR